jgi:hypothetical protein
MRGVIYPLGIGGELAWQPRSRRGTRETTTRRSPLVRFRPKTGIKRGGGYPVYLTGGSAFREERARSPDLCSTLGVPFSDCRRRTRVIGLTFCREGDKTIHAVYALPDIVSPSRPGMRVTLTHPSLRREKRAGADKGADKGDE